jgi:GT2 family glycosyltransferase
VRDAIPEDAAALVAERAAARAARDYGRADAIRDRLRALGWEAVDGPSGTTLRPVLASATPERVGYVHPDDLASLLDEPASLVVSLVVVADEHPDDLARFVAGLAAHPPDVGWELVVVANAPSYEPGPILEAARLAPAPVVLRTSERLGWADAVNLGLRRTRGNAVILLDTSLEPIGEFTHPLLVMLERPGVGIAGGYGVRSSDLREFSDAPPGEVDAIEGYCLAVRREVLRDVGLFDHHFRFYRNADLDFCFAARAAGWHAMRTGPLALARHRHRGYEALPEAERDRLSRRNFYLFLKRWGNRPDLLLSPGPWPPPRRDRSAGG